MTLAPLVPRPLADDVLVFRGPAFESVATAFLAGEQTVLVDTLASLDDALAMRQYLQAHGGARVATIVSTHYMDDHAGGLAAFPEARVLAHPLFGFTHALGRTPASRFDGYRAPDQQVDAPLELVAGRHRLRVFPSAGKTVCMLNVDVPAADLIVAGDNLIGRIVYLSSSTPELLDGGLQRLQASGRRHVVAGHQGAFDSAAVGIARRYLQALTERVRAAYEAGAGWQERVLHLTLEDCMRDDIAPTDFERHWHGQNLQRIVERQLMRVRYTEASPRLR